MKQRKEAAEIIPEAFTNFDQLPNSAFIRLPVMTRLFAMSPASIWRGVKNQKIPAPQKLSERCTAWNVGLIRAALACKVT